jgi:hypothetical protein
MRLGVSLICFPHGNPYATGKVYPGSYIGISAAAVDRDFAGDGIASMAR